MSENVEINIEKIAHIRVTNDRRIVLNRFPRRLNLNKLASGNINIDLNLLNRDIWIEKTGAIQLQPILDFIVSLQPEFHRRRRHALAAAASPSPPTRRQIKKQQSGKAQRCDRNRIEFRSSAHSSPPPDSLLSYLMHGAQPRTPLKELIGVHFVMSRKTLVVLTACTALGANYILKLEAFRWKGVIFIIWKMDECEHMVRYRENGLFKLYEVIKFRHQMTLNKVAGKLVEAGRDEIGFRVDDRLVVRTEFKSQLTGNSIKVLYAGGVDAMDENNEPCLLKIIPVEYGIMMPVTLTQRLQAKFVDASLVLGIKSSSSIKKVFRMEKDDMGILMDPIQDSCNMTYKVLNRIRSEMNHDGSSLEIIWDSKEFHFTRMPRYSYSFLTKEFMSQFY